MTTHLNFQEHSDEILKSQGKVRVTDLLSRLNEEKKIEKKRNLALGVSDCICGYSLRDYFNNLVSLK